VSQKSKPSKKHTSANRQRRPRPIDHINDFFEEYSDFDYEPEAPIWTEFNRMCDEFGWDSDDYEMREARRRFKSAMVQVAAIPTSRNPSFIRGRSWEDATV
jgi:hypothetical protein